MRTNIPKLTSRQKAQILDGPRLQPIGEFLETIAHCAESGPLTVPLYAISRNPGVLNALFERAKRNPRPVGTGVPVLIVTLT